MAIKNPLRYPGAKSKLYDYIYKLLVAENKIGCTFYEPFAGSAAVSLLLLEKKAISKAVINELDPLLYNFWISVFNYTDELVQLIQNTEITVDNWREFSKYRDSAYLQGKTPVQIGFAGLYLNRTSFSGILKANPLGGLEQKSQYKIDCRFNKNKIIKSIQELAKYKDQIEVYNLEALDFMRTKLKYKRNAKTFVYIDPPYYKEGSNLYRCYYTHDQHVALAKFIITKTFPWLISYDDAEQIQKMYSGITSQKIHMDYSVHTSRTAEELLISNLKIPPLENVESQEANLVG